MKLLLDEIRPAQVAAELRHRGHDVVAVAERPDLRGRPDHVVFAVAQAEGRAVVTENVGDYRPLAAAALQHGHSHCGLVRTSNHRFPRHDPGTLRRLVTALDRLLSSATVVANLEHWLS